MRLAGGGTTYKQWHLKALTLHFLGHMDHFVQRGRDQSAQSDQIRLLLLGCLQDFFRWHHDTEVDDLIIVAAQYDPNDVLADVMYVSLHRCHHNPSLRLMPSGTLLL